MLLIIKEKWIYPPFKAHMHEAGNIYARGSQDMKSVGIQYLEAIRRLKLNGVKLKRTVHIVFVPDEELGAKMGMGKFIESDYFKKLNVGFALDEGGPNPADIFIVTYGERSTWDVVIHCTGNTGHSLFFINDTAGEKLRFIINKFMDFREEEKNKLKDQVLRIGNVTTVNLVKIEVLTFTMYI